MLAGLLCSIHRLTNEICDVTDGSLEVALDPEEVLEYVRDLDIFLKNKYGGVLRKKIVEGLMVQVSKVVDYIVWKLINI
jgi:hypothetical protein